MFRVVAVLFVIVACVLVGGASSVYFWHRARGVPLVTRQLRMMWLCLALAQR